MRHHVDRVDRQIAAVLVLLDRRDAAHHLAGETIGALRPGVDDLVVLLALGDQAFIVLLLVVLGERVRLVDDLPLVVGHDDVVLAERDAGPEGIGEAERHDAVAEDDRFLLPAHCGRRCRSSAEIAFLVISTLAASKGIFGPFGSNSPSFTRPGVVS